MTDKARVREAVEVLKKSEYRYITKYDPMSYTQAWNIVITYCEEKLGEKPKEAELEMPNLNDYFNKYVLQESWEKYHAQEMGKVQKKLGIAGDIGKEVIKRNKELEAELAKLKEYKWKYEQLCK